MMIKGNKLPFRASGVLVLQCAVLLVLPSCNKDKKEDGEEPETGKSSPNIVVKIDVVLSDLSYPWGLGYLPTGDLLFTLRNGKFYVLKKNSAAPELLIDRQVSGGEGGLLGLAIDPDFESNHFVYAYETAASNQVVRYKYEGGTLTEDKILISGIPKNNNHNGGVVLFGPDGYLYIGTGDAQDGQLSQNRTSLAGKILRVDREGNPAPGNPFGNAVWSYGHRNVQGLAWSKDGQLFASEHGPSGENGWCCHDELNRIEKGKNYGWPLAYAGNEKDTLVKAIAESGSDTWAPSGCVYTGSSSVWPDRLVVTCLRGERMEIFALNGDNTAVTAKRDTLSGTFGRLRNIIAGQDGSLVFCTSNGDDQILKISAE